KVIYSLVDLYDGGINFPHVDRSADQRVDKLIEQLKDEPALLGWYTNDEMGYGEITAVQQRFKQIQSHDYRPVLQMQNKVEVLPWDYDSSDVIGSDPYPVKATTSQLGIITKRIDFTMQTAN